MERINNALVELQETNNIFEIPNELGYGVRKP